jgi:D-tyrosyl-tRNA(Tyr) deacylase
MRALIQRVERAAVRVIDESSQHHDTVGEIGRGLCVFVGVTHDDDEATARKLADKIWNLRVFDDDAGVMNRALSDGCGDVLVVSQFTLYGDTSKGRRPSWIAAARPDVAEPLVDMVVEALRGLGAHVETGRFRTEMHVELVNDGPVTLAVET